MTALDTLDKALDAIELERIRQYDAQLQRRLDAFIDALMRQINPTWREALVLEYGIADGEPVADGVYRDIPLRLWLEDDEWMIQARGVGPRMLCPGGYELFEDRLLAYLVDTVRPLADAQATPAETPAADPTHQLPPVHSNGWRLAATMNHVVHAARHWHHATTLAVATQALNDLDQAVQSYEEAL